MIQQKNWAINFFWAVLPGMTRSKWFQIEDIHHYQTWASSRCIEGDKAKICGRVLKFHSAEELSNFIVFSTFSSKFHYKIAFDCILKLGAPLARHFYLRLILPSYVKFKLNLKTITTTMVRNIQSVTRKKFKIWNNVIFFATFFVVQYFHVIELF